MQRINREPELRQTTVMFADISGFTSMSESMHPEEITEAVNACFGVMSRAISYHEGHVDKYIGDCAMAVFGAPTAVEFAPLKAVNAAIDLMNQIHRLNEEADLPAPLGLHIGINTGTVYAGVVGSGDAQSYTVMGDIVNLASRLKDISTEGQILVGASTFIATRTAFTYAKPKLISIKGKDDPVPVYELLSRTQQRINRNVRYNRIIRSELVGRQYQLHELKFRIEKAVSGNGAVVSVIGEAGIGKSRLVAEVKASTSKSKLTVVEGSALPIGKNLSFHPINDALRNWIGIGEEDSEDQAQKKLQTAIQNVCHDDFADVYPFIAAMMGLADSDAATEKVKGIEGEALENLVRKSVRQFFARSAKHKPIIFIFEDMHWSDTSSIELIESLLRLSAIERIVFINVFRPGYADTGERLLSAIKKQTDISHLELHIEPLSADESNLLIDNLLKSETIPIELRSAIKIKSEGNPFFIEEVVRSLLDEGIISMEDGRFVFPKSIRPVDIPGTIQELLMLRIDKLEPDVKAVLRIAAVIGRRFYLDVLKKAASGIESLDEILSFLLKAQLIEESENKEEGEYIFRHALAQEAVYNSILLTHKKTLHLRVARAFEVAYRHRLPEFYGMLAYHHSHGGDIDKTERFLIKAGEEALKSSGSSEALHYYRQALKIYSKKFEDESDPSKIAMLERNIALALFSRGQCAESVTYFSKVLDYYGVSLPHSPIPSFLYFLRGLGQLALASHFPQLKYRKSPSSSDTVILDLMYKKLQALVEVDARRYFIESFHVMNWFTRYRIDELSVGPGMLATTSCLFSFTGLSFRFSKRILDTAANIIPENDAYSNLMYLMSRAMHEYSAGEWIAPQSYKPDLVDRNLEVGDLFYTSNYVLLHALMDVYRGKLNDAYKKAARLKEIGELFDNGFSIACEYDLRSTFFLETRQFREAQVELDSGIEYMSTYGFSTSLLYMYSCKSYLHLLLGEIEKAEDALAKAQTALENSDSDPRQQSAFYRSQFAFYLRSMERAMAMGDNTLLSSYRSSATRCRRNLMRATKKMAAHRVESLRLVGRYHWLVGNHTKAVSWWIKSIDEGTRIGAKLDLSRSYYELGQRMGGTAFRFKDSTVDGRVFLKKAKKLFEEIGLVWDIQNMNKRDQLGVV